MHIPSELIPRYLELLERRKTCGDPERAAINALAREESWKVNHASLVEVDDYASKLVIKWMSSLPPSEPVKEQTVQPSAGWSAGGECVSSVRIRKCGDGAWRVTEWRGSTGTSQCIVRMSSDARLEGYTCSPGLLAWVTEAVNGIR